MPHDLMARVKSIFALKAEGLFGFGTRTQEPWIAQADLPFADVERRGVHAPPRRTSPPAVVEMGGHEHRTSDWSVSGFLAKADSELPPIGATVAGKMHLSETSGRFAARVVRVDPGSGEFAGSFTELDPKVRTTIERLSVNPRNTG